MISGLLLLASAGGAPVVAAGCPDPASWRREQLNTGFTRERTLAGLEVPLRSHGRVWREGDTLWWHTESPIEMVLEVDEDGIRRSVEGGPPEPVGGAGASGDLAVVMASLLGGDLAEARQAFRIERQRDPASGDWQVSLRPKSASLARVVQRIELAGCDRLETALIEQPNGDRDRLTFGARE